MGRVAMLGAVLVLVVACEAGGGDGPVDWGEPGAPEDYARYFEVAPLTATPCEGAPAARNLGLRIETFLLRGAGISDEQLAGHTQALARFFTPYGVSFYTRHAPREVPYTSALGLDEARLMKALRAAGLDPNRDPDTMSAEDKATWQEVVLDEAFYAVHEVIADYAPPGEGVNVVVLPAITDETMQAAFGESLGIEIAGLGLSPALVESASAGKDVSLGEVMGLPEEFRATLFVGHEAAVEHFASLDRLIAHEMGHALGLAHTETPGDVMTQGETDACIPFLSVADMDGIAKTEAALTLDDTAAGRLGAAVRAFRASR